MPRAGISALRKADKYHDGSSPGFEMEGGAGVRVERNGGFAPLWGLSRTSGRLTHMNVFWECMHRGQAPSGPTEFCFVKWKKRAGVSDAPVCRKGHVRAEESAIFAVRDASAVARRGATRYTRRGDPVRLAIQLLGMFLCGTCACRRGLRNVWV